MSDELDLLPAMAAGDTAAFGRWVAGVEASVRQTLRPFAALVDTEAVLQEAFLRVWNVVPRFTPDGRPNALLRFTVTTARNVAISELRRAAPTHQELTELDRQLSLDAHVAPVVADPFLREVIVGCRKKLPPQPRAALEQRLSSGGTEADAELATRVRMSLNTFLQNVTRARKLLAECLKRAGVDLEAELSP